MRNCKNSGQEALENAVENLQKNNRGKKVLKTDSAVTSKVVQLFAFDAEQGRKFVIGTDEAGRGCGAGGVFASAVCFKDFSEELFEKLEDLNDSKKLSPKKREILYDIIKENSINSTICIEVDEIEKINILNASLKAMRLAVENVIKELCSGLDYDVYSPENKVFKDNGIIVLVDGNKRISNLNCPQKSVVKGDGKSASIAAASILAKVSRDRYMLKLDEEFPQYNWKENAGYLTKEHMSLIDKFGLCKYHRPSYLQKHFAKQEQLNLF